MTNDILRADGVGCKGCVICSFGTLIKAMGPFVETNDVVSLRDVKFSIASRVKALPFLQKKM